MVLRAGAVDLRLFDNVLEDKVVMAIQILMDVNLFFFVFSKMLTHHLRAYQ